MVKTMKTKLITEALFLEDEEEIIQRKVGDLAGFFAPPLCSMNERKEGTRIENIQIISNLLFWSDMNDELNRFDESNKSKMSGIFSFPEARI